MHDGYGQVILIIWMVTTSNQVGAITRLWIQGTSLAYWCINCRTQVSKPVSFISWVHLITQSILFFTTSVRYRFRCQMGVTLNCRNRGSRGSVCDVRACNSTGCSAKSINTERFSQAVNFCVSAPAVRSQKNEKLCCLHESSDSAWIIEFHKRAQLQGGGGGSSSRLCLFAAFFLIYGHEVIYQMVRLPPKCIPFN